jgi:hypothetical protein
MMHRIPPPEAALPLATSSGGGIAVKVLSGNLEAIPVGALLEASVTRASPKEAVLTVNGQQLTIRPTVQLHEGAVLLIRIPQGSKPQTLEVIHAATLPQHFKLSTPAQSLVTSSLPGVQLQGTNATTAQVVNPTGHTALGTKPSINPLNMVVVDVLAQIGEGQWHVRLNGFEETIYSSEQLKPGGRYIMQMDRLTNGLTLRPIPDSTRLPIELPTAILRGSPSLDFATMVKPVLEELTVAQSMYQGSWQSSSNQNRQILSLNRAAADVLATLQSFLPSQPRPLNATELQGLITKGGLLFEAKLARQTSHPLNATTLDPSLLTSGASDLQVASDLKGDLLRLLHILQEIGGDVQMTASRTLLQGIESHQAANVLAQASGTPYFLQIPFPDGEDWRTLYLALELEQHGQRSDSERPRGFRMLMHVPLKELGETWIDAGVCDCHLRAILYVETPAARDQVRAELAGLHDELLADGFRSVLLDVQPAADLPERHRRRTVAMKSGHPEGVSLVDVMV